MVSPLTIKVFGKITEASYKTYKQNKLLEARNILLEHISEGEFAQIPEDEQLELIDRFLIAVNNGIAKQNLKLLAKLIRASLEGNVITKGIFASQFSKYAKILEELTYDEMVILSIYAKFVLEGCGNSEDTKNKISENVAKYIIKNKIFDGYELYAKQCALQRTGLFLVEPALGGFVFRPNRDFYDLIKHIDFEEIIKE